MAVLAIDANRIVIGEGDINVFGQVFGNLDLFVRREAFRHFLVELTQLDTAALEVQLFKHVVERRLVDLHAEHAVARRLRPRRMGRDLVAGRNAIAGDQPLGVVSMSTAVGSRLRSRSGLRTFALKIVLRLLDALGPLPDRAGWSARTIMRPSTSTLAAGCDESY